MFNINLSNTYKWPVKVMVAADGGRYVENTFDAVFNRLPQERVEALRETIGTPEYKSVDLARQIVSGWSGVQDASGEIPFSQDGFDALLAVPGAAAAIVVAFFESVAGVARKN